MRPIERKGITPLSNEQLTLICGLGAGASVVGGRSLNV